MNTNFALLPGSRATDFISIVPLILVLLEKKFLETEGYKYRYFDIATLFYFIAVSFNSLFLKSLICSSFNSTFCFFVDIVPYSRRLMYTQNLVTSLNLEIVYSSLLLEPFSYNLFGAGGNSANHLGSFFKYLSPIFISLFLIYFCLINWYLSRDINFLLFLKLLNCNFSTFYRL